MDPEADDYEQQNNGPSQIVDNFDAGYGDEYEDPYAEDNNYDIQNAIEQ